MLPTHVRKRKLELSLSQVEPGPERRIDPDWTWFRRFLENNKVTLLYLNAQHRFVGRLEYFSYSAMDDMRVARN
jgi:hypothetical protein